MDVDSIACIRGLGLSAVRKQLDDQSKMWAYQIDLDSHGMRLVVLGLSAASRQLYIDVQSKM